MSATSDGTILEGDLLAAIPETLRNELLTAYGEILRNFRERRWEPSELNGGKLCEIVYSIISGYVGGVFPKKSTKPRNMVDACRGLETAPTIFSRAIRVQIPRVLMALYEIRNNRGVGHVGGDVDPNRMDATCVVEICKWLMSELVRVFHGVTTEQAAAAVDVLMERTLPIVWKVGENLRVLAPAMSMRDKTLVLLYHSRGSVPEADLCRWVEYTNSSIYRRDVLKPTHRAKLIEYDRNSGKVEISPLGVGYVERSLLS
jgi:hypothetical protein